MYLCINSFHVVFNPPLLTYLSDQKSVNQLHAVVAPASTFLSSNYLFGIYTNVVRGVLLSYEQNWSVGLVC